MGPTWGPPGPCRPGWAPCWPHEPYYQGRVPWRMKGYGPWLSSYIWTNRAVFVFSWSIMAVSCSEIKYHNYPFYFRNKPSFICVGSQIDITLDLWQWLFATSLKQNFSWKNCFCTCYYVHFSQFTTKRIKAGIQPVHNALWNISYVIATVSICKLTIYSVMQYYCLSQTSYLI